MLIPSLIPIIFNCIYVFDNGFSYIFIFFPRPTNSSLFPPQLPMYNQLFWLSMPNTLQIIKLHVSVSISLTDLSSNSNKMPELSQWKRAMWLHSCMAVLHIEASFFFGVILIVCPSVCPLLSPKSLICMGNRTCFNYCFKVKVFRNKFRAFNFVNSSPSVCAIFPTDTGLKSILWVFYLHYHL